LHIKINVLEGIVEPSEILEVDRNVETVACDGGGRALGHPVIYLTFNNKVYVDCYYCGRRFVRIGDGKGVVND